MYIKYLNNIHNLKNYGSIVKGGLKDTCIHLQRENGQFLALEFNILDTRNAVLKKIWEELENETRCFDIDVFVETYNIARKYNV